MSASIAWEVIRGTVLLFGTVVLPGVLLERVLARSRSRAEIAFLAPVLGIVVVGTLTTCLAFLLGTVLTERLLIIGAGLTVLASMMALGGRIPSWPSPPTRNELIQGLSIVAMVAVVTAFHWSVYDVSNPAINMRCSVMIERYLLGLPPYCRLNSDIVAVLQPPTSLPEDMAMTCPDDPTCSYREEVYYPVKLGSSQGKFRAAFFGDGQFGYPIIMSPFLISLRFLGFHLFVLITRALCAMGTYVLLRRVLGGHGVPLLIGALVMLNPVAAFAITHNENLAGMFLATAMMLLVLEDGPFDGRRLFAAGMVLGALFGARHFIATSAPAVFLYVALSRQPVRRERHLMLLAAGTLITLLPYLHWHQYLFGSFMGNELAYQREPVAYSFLGTTVRSRLLLNWPFYDTLVRAPSLPLPTPFLLGVTFLHAFGVVGAAAGVLGVVHLTREHRDLSVLLVLWSLPAVATMALVADWNSLKCTYLFLVFIAPAMWIGAGIDRLVRARDKRDLALVVAAVIVLLATSRWAGGLVFPIDSRRPGFDYGPDAFDRDRSKWTDVPLLHGGLSPFVPIAPMSPEASPPFRLFRWSDALSFRDDRMVYSPCTVYVGALPGKVDTHSAELPLRYRDRTFASEFIMNANSVWNADALMHVSRILSFNEFYFNRTLGTRLDPNLLLVDALRGREPAMLEARLVELLDVTPSRVPLLIALGDTATATTFAGGGMAALLPVRFTSTGLEKGNYQPADHVLTRPEAIIGRASVEPRVDAEVVWRYEDGIPLLVRGQVHGHESWFLNALLPFEEAHEASAVLHDSMVRAKGSAVRISLDERDDIVRLDMTPMSNSAVPDHILPTVSLVPTTVEMQTVEVLDLMFPPTIGQVILSVEGETVHTVTLNNPSSYTIMSGPVPVARLVLRPESV